MPHDVFISHSSRDKSAADAVCAALEAEGVACWIAPRDVQPGKVYGAELIQAIAGARVMVLLHSRSSNESSQVHKEVERADAKGVTIVSVRIEQCQIADALEYFLSSVQWIDATRPPLADHLRTIVDAVKALLSEGGARPSRPAARPAQVTASSSRGLLIGASLTAVAIAAGTALFIHQPAKPPPAVVAPAPPRPVTLADLPLPPTAVPQARIEYAAGIQLLRDDSWSNATKHFQRAVELDPGMASAHLRLGIMLEPFPEKARAEMTIATAQRAQLTERERTLLDAMEPMVSRTVPDRELTVARLRAAHERFPLDEEITQLMAYRSLANRTEGLALARRATELDPQDAEGWEILGRSLAYGGKTDEARKAFEKCASMSSESTDCLGWLGALDGTLGQCAALERDARRRSDNDAANASMELADAQVALGRPEEVIRQTLAVFTADHAAEDRAVMRDYVEVPFAVRMGRFSEALALLDEESAAIAAGDTRDNPARTLRVAVLRVQLLLEMGNEHAAIETAKAFMQPVDLSDPVSSRFFSLGGFWWMARLAGVPFDSARHDWVESELKSGQPGAIPWSLGWVLPTINEGDAKAALAALASDSRLAIPDGYESFGSLRHGSGTSVGRIYLLAGRPAEAIPYLRTLADSCFRLRFIFQTTHARLDLAEALRQTGDTAGACAAYSQVVAVWGNAKPRSITADAARAGMKKLGCGK